MRALTRAASQVTPPGPQHRLATRSARVTCTSRAAVPLCARACRPAGAALAHAAASRSVVLRPGLQVNNMLSAYELARVVSFHCPVEGNVELQRCTASGSRADNEGQFLMRFADLMAVEPEPKRALVSLGGGLWLPAAVRRAAAATEGPPAGAHVLFADGTVETHVVRVPRAPTPPRTALKAAPPPSRLPSACVTSPTAA